MELTFVESNALGKVKAWECEFEVTADFNLHIEREKGGRILFYQKSQGAGGWAHIDDMGWQDGKPSIDYDFTALVYPKMIKIVSESEPTFASVATDGEVTEIKSQSKEIEVTANGTTVVEPDAGFAYLNKVSVKTNVAQSGEGGGSTGGGSASAVEYLDLTGLQTMQSSYLATCAQELSLRLTMQGQEAATLGPTAQLISQTSAASKICAKIDFDAPIIMVMGGTRQYSTVRDYLVSKVAELDSIPRITEEEFYTI